MLAFGKESLSFYAMLIEIFDATDYSSLPSELDRLLDYLIEWLEKNNVTVKRYDQACEPENFKRIEEFALPVIMVDGEIISAGAYDFNALEEESFKLIESSNCKIRQCNSCPGRKFCSKFKR